MEKENQIFGIRAIIEAIVAGKEVDKATSVIGAANDGKVYYFENEENFKSYKSN